MDDGTGRGVSYRAVFGPTLSPRSVGRVAIR